MKSILKYSIKYNMLYTVCILEVTFKYGRKTTDYDIVLILFYIIDIVIYKI